MREFHQIRTRAALAAAAAVFLAAGCDGPSGPAPAPHPGLVTCGASNVFHRGDFTHPSRIDSRWMPLVPGTQFIFDGSANRTGEILPHRVVFTVTDLVKEINGIDAVVMWDRDYNNGVLREAELAFFSQDDDQNIWTMGEYPEEYQGDVIITDSVWISGLSGSDPGILVPGGAYPDTILQGWAPNVNFLDCARNLDFGLSVCVPYNCYESVMVMEEWNPYEGVERKQLKYYAPGIGNIRIGALADPEAEVLVLTDIRRLSPTEMDEARREALELEANAYRGTTDYIYTKPCRIIP